MGSGASSARARCDGASPTGIPTASAKIAARLSIGCFGSIRSPNLTSSQEKPSWAYVFEMLAIFSMSSLGVDTLLEPMSRVGIVVERRDLLVPIATIERLGLMKVPVGLEAQQP